MHLTCEKHMPNEENVGQAIWVMDVVKCLLCLIYMPFAKQILLLGWHCWMEAPPNNLQSWKVHGSQHHVHFKLLKVEVLPIELINDFNTLTFTWCHFSLKEALIHPNQPFLDSNVSMYTPNIQIKPFHSVMSRCIFQ